MAKYTVDQVVDTLLFLARKRAIDITNLKLQKLLYYAQAWNLVFNDEALFNDGIEAWVHGPVVPRVFRRFKEFRWKTIDSAVKPASEKALLDHLGLVLDAYGKYGATQLERLTHQEEPWVASRNGLAPDVACCNPITLESMKVFYTKLAHG